jgi:SAM-dependent methyltransferase
MTMPVVPASHKFALRGPSHQNAVDIFEGSWASDFAELSPDVKAGTAPFFTADDRPGAAARVLGRDGRLDGMKVLELGPLEGAHSYQLEKLGAARIVAIEGNAEAYLKCLITKEITGLRAVQFFHGDFTQYISVTEDRYDLVFCSGVLYHMSDPAAVILQLGRIADKCFVWTHYYDKELYHGPARDLRKDPRYPGIKLYEQHFDDADMAKGEFFGGTLPVSVWLSRGDILKLFRQAGLTEIEIIDEDRSGEIGPSFSFAAWRSR